MLEPRVFEKRVGSSVGPRSPARHSVPGCRAAASDASCDPYGPRARARRPRGAMLAISGFQSTAPAARRGEKCILIRLLLLLLLLLIDWFICHNNIIINLIIINY